MAAAPYAQLERQAREAYKGLSVPHQLTLDELICRVEDERGTAIVVKPVEGLSSGQLSGLWMAMPAIDLILHADTASVLHREQIILHELAHMVLGHEKLMEDTKHAGSLMPDLDPELVSRVLARCEHGEEHEIVAEALADMFARAIARTRRGERIEPLNFKGVFG